MKWVNVYNPGQWRVLKKSETSWKSGGTYFLIVLDVELQGPYKNFVVYVFFWCKKFNK